MCVPDLHVDFISVLYSIDVDEHFDFAPTVLLCRMGSMESEAASQLYWGSKLSRLSLTRAERGWYDDRANVYSVLLPPQPHRPGNVSRKTRASGRLRRVLRLLHTAA